MDMSRPPTEVCVPLERENERSLQLFAFLVLFLIAFGVSQRLMAKVRSLADTRAGPSRYVGVTPMLREG